MSRDDVKTVLEVWSLDLTRTFFIFSILLYFLWHTIMTVNLPVEQGQYIYLVSLIFAIILIGAYKLLPRHVNISKIIWLFDLIVAISLSAFFLRQPLLLNLFGIIPFLGALILGLPGWVFFSIIIFGITAIYRFLPGNSDFYGTTVTIIDWIGLLSGLFAWLTIRSFKDKLYWARNYILDREEKIEEARQRLVELSQLQEDMTRANRELLQMYDRLRTMEQVAEEARRVKEQFVANVSHELRTPLNMIIGFCEIINKSPEVYGGELPTILLSDINTILRNSQHLSKLVDDVLDLSQIDSGRMAITKEWTSLSNIIDDAVVAVRPLYKSKELYLRTSIPKVIPRLFVDSTRIRQIIINLLSNAGRFTETGGVEVSVTYSDSEVVVNVTDTGPGISKKDQERIFEPFQQADNSIRRRYDGTGLGLAISKRFVELHGGKISIESEIDLGTKVSFSLPVGEIKTGSLDQDTWKRSFNTYDEMEYRIRNRQNKAKPPDLYPRYVLLEEGQTLKRLMSRYFAKVELVTVSEVDEALRELERAPANALVVNATPFTEPGGTIDQLRSLPYKTPAILCWLPGKDKPSKKQGVFRYLVKPVSKEALVSAVESTGKIVHSILIVDDEIELLQLFARMLNSPAKEYKVWRSRNGQDALDLMRKRQPDVVVLDLIMPIMDGYQVIDNMHKDENLKDIPVIIVSARDPEQEVWISNALTVMRGGGFSADELIESIQAFSKIFSPPRKSLAEQLKILDG